MLAYAVVWVSWLCPGGGWFAPVWPAKLRPLVCAPAARFELYDPARAATARAKVSALGPDAALFVCRGVRCRGPLSNWLQAVQFQEAHP